jgi:RNA 2',3'-cyclic 3'-phosphodiesterase
VPPLTATPDTLRLFIALWPDAATQAWLRACDDAIRAPATAARDGAARWHMTLHFLGAVPVLQVPMLLPALQQPFAPFALEFDRVVKWPRGLLVAEPLCTPDALRELHAALGRALQRAGLPVETRPFRPHVTLARRAAGATLPAATAPQRWPVASYALVASAGGRYRNVALYPAGSLAITPAEPPAATTQTPRATRPRPH